MSARDFLPLLTDSRTIVRTLRQKYGTPDPSRELPYAAGEPARMAAGVHPDRFQVRVARVIEETPDARTLVLAPVDAPLPPYLPGQYVNVLVEVEGVKTSRPMSIASVPNGGDELSLTIKRMPGGFVSHHLTEVVQPGDLLSISGPEGDFHHSPVRDGDDLVFIAGGSGVTPFMGMTEYLLTTRPDARIQLIYGSRGPEGIIFEDRLRRLAAQHERLEVVFVVDKTAPGWEGEVGLIDEALLRRSLDLSAAGKTYFVCGPPAMQRAIKVHLEALGVVESRIRVEAAGPAEDLMSLPGWPDALSPEQRFTLSIEGTDEKIEARAGEPLLNVLERAGHSVPALCRSGCCGSCRTRVVSGEVITPVEPRVRASDRSAGFIHACVGHATGDVTLRVSSARARLTPDEPPLWTPPVEVPVPAPVPQQQPLVDLGSQQAGLPWLRILLASVGLAFFIYLVASLT
jgi:ferredoxin-NADP reductase